MPKAPSFKMPSQHRLRLGANCLRVAKLLAAGVELKDTGTMWARVPPVCFHTCVVGSKSHSESACFSSMSAGSSGIGPTGLPKSVSSKGTEQHLRKSLLVPRQCQPHPPHNYAPQQRKWQLCSLQQADIASAGITASPATAASTHLDVVEQRRN